MPDFYEWPLDWHDYVRSRRALNLPVEFKNMDEFLEHRRAQVEAYARKGRKASTTRSLAEEEWLREKMPYYNVHPMLVPKLCRINLDSVPAHLVEMPHGLKAVNIRFAQKHPELTLADDTPLNENTPWAKEPIRAGDYVHSLMMLKPTQEIIDGAGLGPDAVGVPVEQSVMFLIDFDVVEPGQGNRTLMILPLMWTSPDDSLGFSLLTIAQTMRGVTPGFVKLAANAMRLAVTIGFMANSDEDLIEPDVLSKDRFEYERTDDAGRRKFLVDRARRRGKCGWNVGNDIMFLGEVPGMATKPHAQTGEGRALRWAHIRSGHPHAVRYGEGRRLVKIKWFRPTTVREDLPFKPEEIE